MLTNSSNIFRAVSQGVLSSAGESLSLHPCPGLMAVTAVRVLDPRRSLGGTEPEFSTVGIGVQTTEER